MKIKKYLSNPIPEIIIRDDRDNPLAQIISNEFCIFRKDRTNAISLSELKQLITEYEETCNED
jgi:hypothetical protein